MVVRLVATDLDGTVVRGDGSMSVRTVAALRAVELAGLHLVLVTGRPPRWMHPVVEATGHRGVAVCANGGVVYDLAREEILTRRPLATPVVIEAAQRLRAVLPGVVFAVEDGVGFGREPGYRVRWPSGVAEDVAPLEELADRAVVKLLVRHERVEDSDALLAVVRASLGDLADATHSSPADTLVEVSAAGVSKASTLAQVAAQWGVAAAEVVAFGDQPNDLAMLAWAGRGIAVANAHPDVLAAAGEVTASVQEDGVARVVERVLRDRDGDASPPAPPGAP